MSKTFAKAELLGRVGVDPEMRYTPSGTAVTRLRVATDRSTQDGDKLVDWTTVICWGKLGEAVNIYVQKGARIYVSGRLQYHTYDDSEGQRRTQTEVHAQEVVFLDGRSNGSADTGDEPGPPPDDDLPF